MWNKKEYNIISCRVISSHKGPMYIETPPDWCAWNNPQILGKETGRGQNRRMSRDDLNYTIVEVGQNTEKSLGNLKRFIVTQIPVKYHHLKLVWKIRKRVNNINLDQNNFVLIDKTKRSCHPGNFVVSADHSLKIKESENIDEYSDLSWELKKLWHMRVIPVGILWTVTKGRENKLEELDIRGRIKTIQNAALLKSARILRRVL